MLFVVGFISGKVSVVLVVGSGFVSWICLGVIVIYFVGGNRRLL